MSSFTDPLTVTKIKKGYKKRWFFFKGPNYVWRVERSFRYYVGAEGSAEFIDVQAGEETDFASVPRIFWTLFPPDGPYTQAAVVHDKLCRQKGKIYNDQGQLIRFYTAARSAEIFCEAMDVLEVPRIQKEIMHQAVLRFGPEWDE